MSHGRHGRGTIPRRLRSDLSHPARLVYHCDQSPQRTLRACTLKPISP